MTTPVILVPWRGGDRLREKNWSYARPYLEALRWPIYLGDRGGERWSRAGAINQAAEQAGGWSVALIADADTIPTPNVIHQAMTLALETNGAVRPHDHLWRLTPMGSEKCFRSGPAGIGPRYTTGTYPGGGLLVVSRRCWDVVGPFDERFQEWGHEDTTWNTLAVALADWNRLPGAAWHLWHPESRPPKDKRQGSYATNHRMMAKVQREHRNAITDASAHKGVDLQAIL